MRRGVRKILDKIDKYQRVAGAMEHGDLAYEACTSNEYVFNFTGPFLGRDISEDRIVLQTRSSSLATRTDPRLRARKRGLRARYVHCVEIPGSYDVADRSQVAYPFGHRGRDITRRMQYQFSGTKTDYGHSGVKARTSHPNGVGVNP